jgi:hypothetical protein
MVRESFLSLLYSLVLQDFPESLVIALAVFSFLNLRLWGKRVFFIALLQTGTNLVRLLPIAFGMHSVLLIISLAFYTRIFTGARLSRIFQAALICFALIAAAELIYAKSLLNLAGLTYEAAFANPFWRAAFALPYEVLLFLTALGKDYYNRKRGLVC